MVIILAVTASILAVGFLAAIALLVILGMAWQDMAEAHRILEEDYARLEQEVFDYRLSEPETKRGLVQSLWSGLREYA